MAVWTNTIEETTERVVITQVRSVKLERHTNYRYSKGYEYAVTKDGEVIAYYSEFLQAYYRYYTEAGL